MYRIDTEKLANFKDATTGLREGLEEVLGDALENARRLHVQSKKFVEILEGDESGLHYTGHGYAIGAPIGDGVISVEESTVTKVVESCNHAAETAREIEDITYEIDALLGSLEYVHIDISDQTAKIRKDCTKVERLEEYGRSYKRYAEEFIELDRYLCKALEPYQSEENKGLAEMDLRRYNYYANDMKRCEGQHTVSVENEIMKAVMSDRSIPIDQKGTAIDQRIRFYHALCILESDNATFEYVMEFDYVGEVALFESILLEAQEVSEISPGHTAGDEETIVGVESYNYTEGEIPIIITKEVLISVGWNEEKTTDEMINELNRVLYKYGITNEEFIRHFLAQTAKETCWDGYGDSLLEKYDGETPEEYFSDRDFYYTEYEDGTRVYYNDAPGSPAEEGDGAKYRGAGYIHLTWKTTYYEFAKYIGDPKILEEGAEYVAENYAWESAAWFWSVYKEIDQGIVNGEINTVEEVTIIVNGGTAGLTDRENIYEEVKKYY